MSEPVLNAGWFQFGITGAVPHDMWLPPPVPVPAVPGILEGPAFMGQIAPGASTAPTVFVDGNPGIQQKHNIDLAVPHVPLSVNALMTINILFPKHKLMFPVSSVQLQGKPVGTYIGGFAAALVCADPVSLPMGVLVMNKCTVITTATLADILSGLVDIAVEIVVDFLFGKLVKLGGYLGTGRDLLANALRSHLGDNMRYAPLLAMNLLKGYILVPLKTMVFKPLVGGILRSAAHGNPGVGPLKPFDRDAW